MSGRPVQVFTQSIASGVTVSSSIDLGRAFNKITLVVPVMASGTNIGINVAPTLDGTYKRFYHQPTVTSAAVSFVILSSITNCAIPLPNLHAQYLQIEHSSATTVAGGNAYTYYLICSD
jgi:hypothetical protein